MKKEKQKNCKGFTLLELLVVVVIIEILAAIALPQYQVATKVAKIKGLYPVMRALVEARTNYYLAHNVWTTNMDNLDIEVPYNRKEGNTYYTNWGWFELTANTGDAYNGYVRFKVNNTNVTIVFHYGHYAVSYGYINQGICYAPKNNKQANEICGKLGTRKSSSSTDNIYLFY